MRREKLAVWIQAPSPTPRSLTASAIAEYPGRSQPATVKTTTNRIGPATPAPSRARWRIDRLDVVVLVSVVIGFHLRIGHNDEISNCPVVVFDIPEMLSTPAGCHRPGRACRTAPLATLSSWFAWRTKRSTPATPPPGCAAPARHVGSQPWCNRNELTDLLAVG